MYQNEIEKSSKFKNYVNDIDFNSLYNNFSNLYNEYSESEIVNSQINVILEKIFQLNYKEDEIKLFLNIDFLKKINIATLIECYNSEKIGKREKFLNDLVENDSKYKFIVTPKSFLYTRNVLLFIIIKYYKQIVFESDKITEEKISKFLIKEINSKEEFKNNDINIFSNKIDSFYKILARKFLKKKEENSNIEHFNAVEKNNDNLNEAYNENKISTNIIIIHNNQLSNSLQDIFVNHFKECTKLFFTNFFSTLTSKYKENIKDINNNTNNRTNLNCNIILNFSY